MSAALDDFNAFIAAKKAQIDTYNTARKAEVTASNLSNAEKNQVRALLDNYTADVKAQLDLFQSKGEDFYVRVLKECARHLRKHVVALATPENQAVSDLVRDRIDNLTTEDDGAVVVFAKTLVG